MMMYRWSFSIGSNIIGVISDDTFILLFPEKQTRSFLFSTSFSRIIIFKGRTEKGRSIVSIVPDDYRPLGIPKDSRGLPLRIIVPYDSLRTHRRLPEDSKTSSHYRSPFRRLQQFGHLKFCRSAFFCRPIFYHPSFLPPKSKHIFAAQY